MKDYNGKKMKERKQKDELIIYIKNSTGSKQYILQF